MSSEPLLPEGEGAPPSEHPVLAGARKSFRNLVEKVVGGTPATAARATESLDYEPVQNDLYFQRLKQRRNTRQVYGYASVPL
jgi:hypothetical protein